MSTPRFDLDTYQQGDDNWSHTDTVELLDELAVETDTISNRPTSGSYDDELFFATDQKLLYRWDNSESDWLVEGGVGTESDRLPNVWADTVNSNVTKHATDISEDYVVDSGEGAVFAGPITGSGSISGNGQVSVIQEGHQFTDNVDAQGNDINNVGTLEAGKQSIGNLAASASAVGTDQTIPNDTQTVVEWNSESISSDEVVIFNESENSITVQESGIFSIDAAIMWDSSANWSEGDRIDISVEVNASVNFRTRDAYPNPSQNYTQTISTSFDLSAGDEITITVIQRSGSDQSINPFGSSFSDFSVVRQG